MPAGTAGKNVVQVFVVWLKQGRNAVYALRLGLSTS
jgi:hypothetical protein